MNDRVEKKKEYLRKSGTLNPNPDLVKSDLFKKEFFDPNDRAQVKYEMVRKHLLDRESIAEACRKFGFSREGFYKIMKALTEEGFSSLMPGKRGRKGPTKFKGPVLDFALEKQKENPDIDLEKLSKLISERFKIDVHRTTVTRGIKKKRSRS